MIKVWNLKIYKEAKIEKLLQYTLLAIIALAFSACSSVNHHLTLYLDTNPKGAEIICDGESIGFSPLDYNLATGNYWNLDDKQYSELKRHKVPRGLPKCKAKWVSGYEDFYKASATIDDFVLSESSYDTNLYVYQQTLNRRRNTPSRSEYATDKLAEKRFEKIYNAPEISFNASPKGADILCNGEFDMIKSTKKALKTGIFTIPQCKAVFISGYEQFFKNSINIDKYNISNLFIQNVIRPNTDSGYAKDKHYALEVERKEIMEANERARTQAAQDQARAAQMSALAAQRQARAAQQQADATDRQANAARDQANAIRWGINKPTTCIRTGNMVTCN